MTYGLEIARYPWTHASLDVVRPQSARHSPTPEVCVSQNSGAESSSHIRQSAVLNYT